MGDELTHTAGSTPANPECSPAKAASTAQVLITMPAEERDLLDAECTRHQASRSRVLRAALAIIAASSEDEVRRHLPRVRYGRPPKHA